MTAMGLFVFFLSNGMAQDKLVYTGSSTVGVFIEEAARIYKAAEFAVINTKPESGGGETATAMGKTDLGGVSREISPEIIDQGVKKFLIGKDAIGVWVNAKNPVDTLTVEQLKGIFTGAIENWKEVGGLDMPINAFIVNYQSATRKVFQDSIMPGIEYNGKHIHTIRPDPAILDKVAADKGGIGQLSFSFGVNYPDSAKIKTVNIGDQKASIKNRDYPITRPLYLITKGEPIGAVKAFIDWSLSDEGQSIVQKYFVGIK